MGDFAFSKGQRLCGRFVLLESLHAHGVVGVWRALDEQRSAQVALKCIARSADPSGSLWRSLQHQHAVRSRMQHEHLLQIDEPLADRDALILPMQLAAANASALRGKSWKQWLSVAIDVARALAHMHACGYVHRDLKPANILIDFRGDALLADFGAACAVGESVPATGSPFSASPAQLRGEPARIADDVYGFGALLHEWLTGYPPYFPQRPDPEQMPELPDMQCAAETPEHLQTLVQDLLRHDVASRPAGMSEVVARLEGDLGSRPQVIISADPERAERVGADRPRRSGYGRVGGALAATLLVLLGMWWGLPRLTEIRSDELAAAFAAAREATQRERQDSESTAGARGEAEGASPAARFAALETSYLQQLGELETRGAGAWGGELFAAGKSLGRLARDAADDRNWDLALDRVNVAIRRLERVEADSARIKTERLADAVKALDLGQLELARQNFELVRQMDPAENQAAEGLARVAALVGVLPTLADAESALLGGDPLRALTLYEQVLRADGLNRTATQGLQQAQLALGDDRYGQAIGQALAELRGGDFSAAEQSLIRASALRPNAAEIAAARAQVSAGRERRLLEGERESILALEQAERWSEALARYEQVLARDPGLVFAQVGRERVATRARIEQRLNALLDDPARLSAVEVRGEAARLLTQTERWVAQGPAPVLVRQRAALQAELERYAVRIRAVIESDGLTEVRIQRVGTLGTFERKELQLQPGRYVVVGSRQGFRDVRREFDLVPGQSPPTIDIRCTESIS